MYSILGNELYMDRGYSFYGEVRLGHSFILAILLRLGNWPHMLDNGPH